MRWIVSLVAACCLLAASRAHAGDVGAGGRESKQRIAENSAAAWLVARRDSPRPALRLSPFDTPTTPALEVPARTSAGSMPSLAPELAEPARPVPSARGPPRG